MLLSPLRTPHAIRDFQTVELLAKRTGIQEAQRPSPSLKFSFKTLDPGAGTDEAI